MNEIAAPRIERVRNWARSVMRDALAVWIVARDARTPWHAKAIAVLVASYAFSPIDLIPDFIPVLGYLDDLILVPLGVMAVVALVPGELMAEFRAAAARRLERPRSVRGAVLVIAVWLAAVIATGWLLRRYWPRELV